MNVQNLTKFLEAVKRKPYELGRWDCLEFTNQAWKETYGKFWCPEWCHTYNSKATFQDFIDVTGFEDVSDAINYRLRFVGDKAPFGSLVALRTPGAGPLGKALGISLGAKSVFVGYEGLSFVPTKLIKESWTNA